MTFSKETPIQGMNLINYDNMDLLILPPQEAWFAFKDLDLTGVKAASLVLGWVRPPDTSIDFEIRLNAVDGELIGKGSLPRQVQGQEGQITRGLLTIRFNNEVSAKGQDLYFIYKPKEGQPGVSSLVALVSTIFQAGP